MKTKSLIAGLAISMAVMGSAMAGELATMEGIPAEAMSQGEMDKVEGKFYVPCVAASICGFRGGNALTGNWSWTRGLFKDIKVNYPQVWYPLYPRSYRFRF
jgi:hypothetical protein